MSSVIIGGADGPTAIFLTTGGNIWLWVLSLVIAYLLGNISPSTLLAKAKGIDIHKEGSGNAGTTNALRVMGKKAGVITLVVDVLKGTVAVLIGFLLAGSAGEAWCVLAVFCGHVWPVFYKFKGGKGVATAFGALLGLNPLMALLTLLIVVIAVLISKRMSVGSITERSYFRLFPCSWNGIFSISGSYWQSLSLVKHRANIMRLLQGKEPVMSIFEKKKTSDGQED